MTLLHSHIAKRGAFKPETASPRQTCTIPECHRVVRARGLCNGHYERARRTGDPLPLALRDYNSRPPLEPGNYAPCPPAVLRHAACRNIDPNIMFPETRGSSGRGQPAGVTKAKTICATCPVRQPCGEWALTTPDPVVYGVAGGMTTTERIAIRRRKKAA